MRLDHDGPVRRVHMRTEPEYYRISSLTSLKRCPVFSELKRMKDGMGSKASHTGTAVGYVVERLHRHGFNSAFSLPAALVDARMKADEYPLADWDKVEKWATGYAEDPRNAGVIVDSLEAEVEAILDPHPTDPTGLPIKLVGHLDQLREDEDGTLVVWDIKGSSKPGPSLVLDYAWQLAGYTVAVHQTFEEPVRCGGIIKISEYGIKTREPRPFYTAPWSYEDCLRMLDNVRFHIARLREGTFLTHPGEHCMWSCPGLHPHLCEDELKQRYLEETDER